MGSEALCFLIIHLSMRMYMCVCVHMCMPRWRHSPTGLPLTSSYICIYFVSCTVVLQVKVWKTSDGFCFVTFTQHSAGVTGVTFTQTGKVVDSYSLDGTVRAFDMNKSVVMLLSVTISTGNSSKIQLNNGIL